MTPDKQQTINAILEEYDHLLSCGCRSFRFVVKLDDNMQFDRGFWSLSLCQGYYPNSHDHLLPEFSSQEEIIDVIRPKLGDPDLKTAGGGKMLHFEMPLEMREMLKL